MRYALISDIHSNLPALQAVSRSSLGLAVIGGIWRAHWLSWLAPTLGLVAAMQLYEVLRSASAPPSPRDVATGVEGPIVT